MSAPRIDAYRFGHIVISGQSYTQDVIILPDRVLGGWWREQGHVLNVGDLAPVFEAAPQVLVVGQGASSHMHIPRTTREAIEAAHIELITLPTDEACQTYNRLCRERRVAAALHLTC